MTSFPSAVFTMPGESPEKLPFVHSTFKPRSKFAKSFGGRRCYSKSLNRDSTVTKLPQITYDVADHRTLITFGAIRRGMQREYPGFLGRAKVSRRKQETKNVNETSRESLRDGRMYKYGSLPNLVPSRRQADKLLGNKTKTHGCMSKRNDEFEEISDLSYDKFNNNLDSLIFLDDDGPDGFGKSPSPHKLVDGNDCVNDCLSDKLETSTLFSSVQNLNLDSHKGNILNDLGKSADSALTNDDTDSHHVTHKLPVESMSKELDKKIDDARGKSGMKRSRRKENDHIRRLGDVMTSERLTEMLSPRHHRKATITFCD